MIQNELIPHLFRTEYSKITAVLCKNFGFEHIEIAEDIASDTFLSATETWGIKGEIPANPAAWLHAVAKNKAKNYLTRRTTYNSKIVPEIRTEIISGPETEIDLSEENITDSQLQMMFAICNPIIPSEAQIALALRVLCGFGIGEIADAFLTNKETVNKRIFRAKEKLKAEKIKIELPDSSRIDKGLENVLIILYLLFNEGYYSQSQNSVLRKDLCAEAMRLTYLLLERKQTNKPVVKALLSLMCFHSSRFEARMDGKGETILYAEQDPELWNEELILRGQYYLIEASENNSLSRYHLEAAIAYWHTNKADTKEKWENVLKLYNQLLLTEYSPVIALSRTYALSKVYGKPTAIEEAEKLKMKENHLYYCLLGFLWTDLDNFKAEEHYRDAYSFAKTTSDKSVIKVKIDELVKMQENNQ